MVISSLTVPSVHANEVQSTVEKVNLAKNRPVVATGEYPTMKGHLAVDGDLNTRWATENADHAETNHSITVELKAPTIITGFKVYFEQPGNNPELQRVIKYKVEASTDGKNFEDICNPAENAEGYAFEDEQSITNEKKYTHVRLLVERLKPNAYPSISVREFEVYGDQDNVTPEPEKPSKPETPVNQNIAAGRMGDASADKNNIGKLTDGSYDKAKSRWSAEAGPTQWFSIDLGKVESFNTFKATWESDEEHAKDYKIYVSQDGKNWGDAVVTKTGNNKRVSEDVLENNVEGRYVKVEITAISKYPNVSCCEFEVFNKDESVQDPTENVAQGKPAVANGSEASNLTVEKAFDGNHKDTRWASPVSNGPHWIRVDLGKTMDVQTIRLYWETRKAKEYAIEYTTDETVSDATTWETFESFTDHPTSKIQIIQKDAPVKARYLRLNVKSFTANDPDGGATWNTISVYEMEVYGGKPKVTLEEQLNDISVQTVKPGDKKVAVNIPEIPGYTVQYNGTDYEQVVDEELNIFTPIVDTEVTLSFKATNNKNPKDHVFKEVKTVVPGQFQVAEGDNEAPKILPELREWKGHSGSFALTKDARIMIADEALRDMATTFRQDLKDATGIELAVVVGTNPQAGDLYFNLNAKNQGLGKEGYKMTIADAVTVDAEDATGAFWATRTVLQALKASGENTMPKGITRDYPLYSVRGFILDVGRKTFTMDYLTQFMKQMSYYKLNDFHVHLNDNLIPLEHYNPDVEAIMNAYSGFRLESDIKEGGNGGKNKADLTSKDVFYTKDQFRSFIKDARVRGVNIVPEIDVPAHSLALTKVRPDLRHGTSGRENDHLNLTSKYDESLEFVKEIFDEYITGPNPVFDAQTTVHFGADEYTADGNAYRRFVNDMKAYLAENNRQARVWGSLSSIKGSVPVTGEGVEMNVWNTGWAKMDVMYDKGFDLINCVDSKYYIVPNAGYYYDYLNANVMYNDAVNEAGGVRIPAGDPQMKGASFAVWNDMCDYLNNGVTEYDVFDRANESLPLFAAKLWGKDASSMSLTDAQSTKEVLGNAPGTNFTYELEPNENGIYEHIDAKNDVKGTNVSVEKVDFKEAIKLNGGESYINTNLNTTLGLNTSLKFKVKRTGETTSEDQILFEGSYGQIIGTYKDSGKFGIRRENFDLVFDYELPLNRWVEVELVNGATGRNNQNFTELYVNGTLINRLGDDERATENKKLLGTTMIPFERVGSKTHAFVGYIDDIRVTKAPAATDTPLETKPSNMALEYAIEEAMYVLQYGKYSEQDGQELESYVAQTRELLAKEVIDESKASELERNIREVLSRLEITEADYSQVDAAIASIPKNAEKFFTAESLAKLDSVIKQVRRGLPAEMQETVNTYAKEINAAIKGLVKISSGLSEDNYYAGKMTGTASNYQGGTGPELALDGNNDTFWHSQWNDVKPPYWFLIELAEAQKVDGLYYLPRQDGTLNGTATKYEIWAGMDKDHLTKVADGSLANNKDAKTISFEPVDAKFVKFVIVQGANNNGSAAEFKVHVQPTKADMEGLKALINQAESLDRSLYTKESLKALDKAVEAAKALDDSATYHEVEAAKAALVDALVYGLETITPETTVVEVDRSALNQAIASANAIDRSKYTDASLKVLDDAVKAAQSLPEDATQRQVNDAAKAINDAIASLEIKKPGVTPDKVDFSKLAALVKKAKAIKADGYTKDSYKALQDVIVSAEKVLDNSNVTQEQADAMVKALQAAIDGLTKIQETSRPNTDQERPNTGDYTNITFFIGTLGLAAATLYLIAKKRKEDIQ